MINKAIVHGRIVADPELRTTGSGMSVCSFRVAWSEKYKERETKLFLNCTAWGKTGEFIANYFEKGKEVVVEGKLSTREWEDKENNKRSTIELTVSEADFCGSKSDSGNYSEPAAASPYTPTGTGYTSAPDADGFAELADDGKLPF